MRAGLRAIATGLALSGLAWAQTNETRVLSYLEYGMAAHERDGYGRERTLPDLSVALSLDSPHLWPIYLREGATYRVFGACDDHCADLDMEIYGTDGRLLARDVARNDTPVLEITPTATGRHYVRLWLYTCDADRCHVAARVMRRQDG